MAISTRRKRRKLRYGILGAALLLAALAALFFLLRGRSKPAEPPALPTAPPTPMQAQTASEAPAPTPSSAPQDPAATPNPQAPGETPVLTAMEEAQTPPPVLPLKQSALERSLYQGRLSIGAEAAAGSLSLTYVNKGVDTLYTLYLHLYPNTVVPGSLAIEAASLSGVRTYYTLEREGALLCLPLINELRSGEAVRVFLRFRVTIPKYGFGQALAESRALPLLCVFPTAAVYENGWVLDSAPGQVDFAPLADWRLLIEAARVPSLKGGETQEAGMGRYLCTAQAYLPELSLE